MLVVAGYNHGACLKMGDTKNNNFDVKNDDKPWYLEIPYLQTEPFFGVGNKKT